MDAPFLSALGISLIDQGIRPSLRSYPMKFNPNASACWSVVLQALPEDLSVEDAWSEAVSRFVEVCSDNGVYPFREETSSNQQLQTHLKKCRDELLHVLGDVIHPLLDQHTVLSITRNCDLSADGFLLSVTSTFKNEDPTFEQHLLNLGFGIVNKVYFKRINQQVNLQFRRLEGLPSRWSVKYEITGRMLPELPGMVASKAELEKYLIRGLWFPLTKDSRPEHQGPRFI
jgi:hypothetical protein